MGTAEAGFFSFHYEDDIFLTAPSISDLGSKNTTGANTAGLKINTAKSKTFCICRTMYLTQICYLANGIPKVQQTFDRLI